MSESTSKPSIYTSSLKRQFGPTLLAFLATLTVSAAILIHFYDRFWWPADDGAYAYVAARVLAGDVLNRDVQDIHMGYINFFNAFIFWLFGDRLVSLRLPLVATGLVQACIIFFLFRPRGIIAAMVTASALTALSFVQFLNPTPHWYALFLMISIIGCFCWIPRENLWRAFIIGLLLMTLFLFRQLSGAIAGVGVMAYLLFEAPRGAVGRNTLIARSLMAIMLVGLGGYLLAKSDPTAFLLFGIWPLTILGYGLFKMTVANREIARQCLSLILGGAVAAAPLFAYHFHHGSFGTWYTDTVLSAFNLTGLDFIGVPRHLIYAINSAIQIVALENFDATVNGLFWVSLVFVTPVLGILLLIDLLRRDGAAPVLHPLPFLALFYGPISVHYQIPNYLFFTVGLSLTGLIWMLTSAPGWRYWTISICAIFFTVTGLHYHAAQPASRGLSGMLKGTRTAVVTSEALNHVGLSVESTDIAVYRHISELVEREVRADQTILAIPVNPEIYFITERRSPFRFFSSALGIQTEAELTHVLKTMRNRPPQLVFHRPGDKYNTKSGDAVMAYVREHYTTLKSHGGFNIYRYREN
ncbi:MAG: hypothetical protein GKS00_08935 [Alphaproteobacteria bacterium]|nr:hypothetical protein [Alphaproteobacteria bacterium]